MSITVYSVCKYYRCVLVSVYSLRRFSHTPSIKEPLYMQKPSRVTEHGFDIPRDYTMSFFGALNNGGIRGPDVAINQAGGNLLPNSGSGIRFSSAQINQQSSLLSGVSPYSYGQHGNPVSDDISHGLYQPTPNP